MIEDKFTLKDSGKREEYFTGMVRDERKGKGRFDLISPVALLRLARIYEKGAQKYAPRNWEKGANFSRFIDSALRHIVQYMLGERDEDHLAQAAWNLFAVMHLETTHPEMDDLPFRNDNLQPLPKKVKVSVCQTSGLKPGEWCTMVTEEEFELGDEPRETCSICEFPKTLKPKR